MKKLFNSLKIIGIAAVLAVGVSYVSAFTRIPNTPVDNPSENTPEFVTVGGPLATFQTKLGALSTESFFKSGNAPTAGSVGWIVAANNAAAADRGGVTSLWQFFQKEYLPGTKSQMKVGSAIPARSTNPLPSVDKTKFNPNDTAIPLTIDLMDRGTANNSAAGTQVMNLLASNSCNATSTIQTNTPGVQFWSTKNSANADVIAGGIQIGDSTAGAKKVLVATDDKGNAEWGTMSVEGGRIIVDYPSKATGNNIVKYGQLCATPPVTPPTPPAPTSCFAYQLKANCYGSLPATSVYVPAGCTKTTSVGGTCAGGSAQEIYTIECTSPQTASSISSGAAAAGFPATGLNNQNPQQCIGPNAPMTAWMCHTAGAPQWVTAESRGQDITCTKPYLPQLLPGEAFSEGDIVCTENRPALSLCKKLGTPKSDCRPGDTLCP